MRRMLTVFLISFLVVGGFLVSAQGGAGPDNCQTCDQDLKIRGDANNDCRIDLSDAVFILNRLFLGGAEYCAVRDDYFAANVNGDKNPDTGEEKIDLSDAVYLLRHLFQGGPEPAGLGCVDLDNDGFNARKPGCGPVDCNDGNGFVNPNAEERCDLLDNNCDGKIDDVCAGDAVRLDTASQKLYYKSKLDDARTLIGKNEMPIILSDGKVVDFIGVEYRYTQTIAPGKRVIEYGTNGGDLNEPTLHISGGTDAAQPIYTYEVVFNRNLDPAARSNFLGRKITLTGKEYIFIGMDGDLLSFLSGLEVKANEGETVTISIGGKDHEIMVIAIDGADASISVDGNVKEVSEGELHLLGGLVIYINDLVDQPFVGGLHFVEMIVSENDFLTLRDGQAIAKGSNNEIIRGSKAVIGKSDGMISGFTIAMAMQQSELDHIELGGVFKDPVFGRLNLVFAATNPPLTGLDSQKDREEIRVDTDNNQFARVTFKPLTAFPPDQPVGIGCQGGGPDGVVTCSNTITFAWDSDTSATRVRPVLAHRQLGANEQGKTHVVEGEEAKLSDWIVINNGDAGAIFEVVDITIVDVNLARITLENVFTHESITTNLNKVGGAFVRENVLIHGQPYNIQVNAAGTSVQVTWGAGSAAGSVGDVATLFPRIKTSKGGWIAILSETDLDNIKRGKIALPGVEDLAAYEAGGDFPVTPVAGFNIITVGNIKYFLDNTGSIVGMGTNDDRVIDCDLSLEKGPAILIQEERKPNEAGNSENGDIICIPLVTIGTAAQEIAIGDPKVSGISSGFTTWSSDVFKKTAVTRYGSFIEKIDRTNQNGVAVVHYPDNQMYLDILFTG